MQLWRGVDPPGPICGENAQRRNGQMVWQADRSHRTQQAGPFYILLVDMFRGHDEYGEEDHIVLDSEAWREEIIEAYQ